MAVLLDGKAVSEKVKAEIKTTIEALIKDGKRPPCLAVILVGEDPASQIYVRNKVRDCEETGIISKKLILSESTGESELLSVINGLNADDAVDGILVQMPLPKHIYERTVVEAIAPSKDVDAFHPVNVGNIFTGFGTFAPCTPSGILKLLDEYGISVSGKNCVVVGRSNIVGKPMAILLLQRNGTVTICHSKTKSLSEHTKNADILVVATGKAGLINGGMVKEGAVIVDVGMNRVSGKLVGDCDFPSCEAKASYITPVPGGVGPMTRAVLLCNTLKAYTNR
ncbi:MAG: bifunctional methylenetetrahydrofolate dehydrogenase/methenyltetrahydrofolate cyclohydrolase FolD [Eubacteriales bacterium]|nr:bifunctional methylenetetrahydrofolate dehydrogenase/methenyltetrahydrofolate cyclohydrolase FolD [Eubacteriales bacterium]